MTELADLERRKREIAASVTEVPTTAQDAPVGSGEAPVSEGLHRSLCIPRRFDGGGLFGEKGLPTRQ